MGVELQGRRSGTHVARPPASYRQQARTSAFTRKQKCVPESGGYFEGEESGWMSVLAVLWLGLLRQDAEAQLAAAR